MDDNPGILQVFSSFLSMVSNAEITCFESAEAALLAIRTEPERFPVVITDMEMPGMNGIEFRKQLESVSPRSKVLLTTGNHAVIDEPSARLIGFRGLIYKPFSLPALKQTLEEAGAFEPEHRSSDEVIFSRPI